MTYISLKGYVGQFKRECTDILKVVITIKMPFGCVRFRQSCASISSDRAETFFFCKNQVLTFCLTM